MGTQIINGVTVHDPQPLPFKYREEQLDKRGKGLLAILRRANGEWMTRSEIDSAKRGKSLNQADFDSLSDLAQHGLIETQFYAARRWEYRALTE